MRTDSPRPSPRYNYFWPIQIYLIGALVLSFSEVASLENQLDSLTQTADDLDPAVKRTEFHKARFYVLVRGLLRLAPNHPAAQKIIQDSGLLHLKKDEPFQMSLDHPDSITNLPPVTFETTITPPTPADLLASPVPRSTPLATPHE